MIAGNDALRIDPRLLEELTGIELKSRFLVRGLYASRHRTADHGPSSEFVEHRDYRFGDELRSVDWRAFARTERLYVKVYEMESNMRIHLFLDTSDSMRVPAWEGLPGKLGMATVIAGAIGAMGQAQRDAVGLLCAGDRLERQIPARQGEAHLALLYRQLENPPGRGGGGFGDRVVEAGSRLGGRGMVVLLTDALDDPEALLAALQRLRVRRHDATVIQILDRREVEFPYDRMTEFRHPETGRRIVGHPASLRERYLERLRAHVEKIREICRKSEADHLFVHTGDDLRKLLALHFIRRLLRRSR
jgi:uncharacterized protein (DUF58 family)